jgi:hypothetical protein
MTYETAPATVMLATHCAICGRPLVDARSVETGIGPDCRAKYGKADVVTESQRSEANGIVYRLALWRSEVLGGPTIEEVAEDLRRVRQLGLFRLADVLDERLCDVVLVETSACLELTTPFKPSFVSDLRSSSVPLRRWNAEKKAWEVAANASKEERARLWACVRRHFEGRLFKGPRGVTTITAMR